MDNWPLQGVAFVELEYEVRQAVYSTLGGLIPQLHSKQGTHGSSFHLLVGCPDAREVSLKAESKQFYKFFVGRVWTEVSNDTTSNEIITSSAVFCLVLQFLKNPAWGVYRGCPIFYLVLQLFGHPVGHVVYRGVSQCKNWNRAITWSFGFSWR